RHSSTITSAPGRVDHHRRCGAPVRLKIALPTVRSGCYRHLMATDPRAALDRLFAAFEEHLDAVEALQDDEAPVVLATADSLAEAFENYDEALYEEYGVDTPLVVYDGDDDEDEDLEYDDLDEDALEEDILDEEGLTGDDEADARR